MGKKIILWEKKNIHRSIMNQRDFTLCLMCFLAGYLFHQVLKHGFNINLVEGVCSGNSEMCNRFNKAEQGKAPPIKKWVEKYVDWGGKDKYKYACESWEAEGGCSASDQESLKDYNECKEKLKGNLNASCKWTDPNAHHKKPDTGGGSQHETGGGGQPTCATLRANMEKSCEKPDKHTCENPKTSTCMKDVNAFTHAMARKDHPCTFHPKEDNGLAFACAWKHHCNYKNMTSPSTLGPGPPYGYNKDGIELGSGSVLRNRCKKP